MLRVTVLFTDNTFITARSEFSPKFSENFICIAPFGKDTDEFYNVASIKKITVEPDR
jgi:hypothetical protein